MRLMLHELCSNHPKLRWHTTDLSRCGALALRRAGHVSPVEAGVDHDGEVGTAEIHWLSEGLSALEVLDRHRVTEDGAEAVALAYVHARDGWVVKRRLQRTDSADWLLRRETGELALEVSGTDTGDAGARLKAKRDQVARCTLRAERLAVVVAFDAPSILAGHGA